MTLRVVRWTCPGHSDEVGSFSQTLFLFGDEEPRATCLYCGRPALLHEWVDVPDPDEGPPCGDEADNG